MERSTALPSKSTRAVVVRRANPFTTFFDASPPSPTLAPLLVGRRAPSASPAAGLICDVHALPWSPTNGALACGGSGRTRAPAETHGRAPRPHPWRRRRARDARRDSSARVQQRQQIPSPPAGDDADGRAVGPEAQEQAEDVDWAPRWRPRRDVQSGGSASRVGRRRRRRRPALADIRPRRRGDDRGRRDDDGRRRGSNRAAAGSRRCVTPRTGGRCSRRRPPTAARRVWDTGGSKALARPRRRRERGATRDGDVAGGVLADDRRLSSRRRRRTAWCAWWT